MVLVAYDGGWGAERRRFTASRRGCLAGPVEEPCCLVIPATTVSAT